MTYMPRIQTFGRNAVRLNARPGEFLDIQAIRAHAPAIFAEEPHSSRSERFAHIPTHDMLSALMHEGFMPTGVAVGGSSDADKRAHTKHMIRLRRVEHLGTRQGDVYPEVVLKNAHDGTSMYHLMFGLFRLVCMNGLVVADGAVADVKVPHKGRAIDKVIEGSYSVIEHAGDVIENVQAMKAIELSPSEEKIFAKAALIARFGEEVPDALREDPTRVIEARRFDDKGPDLWRVFNTAQENLIRGGISFDAVREVQGRRQVIHQTTRPVRSVDGDIKLNRALWTLAEEMRALKG